MNQLPVSDDSELMRLRLIDLLRGRPGIDVVWANDTSEFSHRRCLEVGADAFFDRSAELETAAAWTQRQIART